MCWPWVCCFRSSSAFTHSQAFPLTCSILFTPLPDDLDSNPNDEEAVVQIVNHINPTSTSTTNKTHDSTSTNTTRNLQQTLATPTPTIKTTMQNMPTRTNQKAITKRNAVPPSRERNLQVAKLIEQGKLKAPEVEQGEVLILHDGGTAPNIACHEKHFQGAQLTKGKASGAQSSTATRQGFASSGDTQIPVESLEGHERTFTFKNANVSIPILSTGRFADEDHDSLSQKTEGQLLHVPTGEGIHLFRMHGVYFFKFNISQSVLKPCDEANQDVQAGTDP